MKAKQTGPIRTVKAFGARSASIACGVVLLAGCAGPAWVNPNKTPAELRADEKECSKQAEDYAMLRAAKSPIDYGLPPTGPGPNNAGTSPMEMKDRDAVQRTYHADLEDCMESKGYIHGKDNQD